MSLVKSGAVSGWDDPRMPTISGLRRRGYPPEALQEFVKLAGVAKRENIIEASLLEFCAREELNKTSNRVMVVMDPLKLTITNYPNNEDEILLSENNPENPLSGQREVPFGKELYIEKEDFKIDANKKFFRLTIGKEVRLKSAYIIKANEVVYDDNNNIIEVLCTYDSKSKSGSGSEESQRKVKGTLHWVSKKASIKIEVNEYDRLFENPNPAESESEEELLKMINPNSSKTVFAQAEPSLSKAEIGDKFQFQRKGYFIVDNNKTPLTIFNKTVGLRDNWKK